MAEKKPRPKTYKRETAVTLAVVAHAAAGWLLWGLVEAEQWESAVKVFSATLTADMLFLMGAFGIDAVSQQTRLGNRPPYEETSYYPDPAMERGQ